MTHPPGELAAHPLWCAFRNRLSSHEGKEGGGAGRGSRPGSRLRGFSTLRRPGATAGGDIRRTLQARTRGMARRAEEQPSGPQRAGTSKAMTARGASARTVCGVGYNIFITY